MENIFYVTTFYYKFQDIICCIETSIWKYMFRIINRSWTTNEGWVGMKMAIITTSNSFFLNMCPSENNALNRYKCCHDIHFFIVAELSSPQNAHNFAVVLKAFQNTYRHNGMYMYFSCGKWLKRKWGCIKQG